MSLSHFLARTGVAKSSGSAVERLQAALVKLHEEREEKVRFLDTHAHERRRLLLESDEVDTVLRHDISADRTRLSIEMLDEIENELREAIRHEEDKVADSAWRSYSDLWFKLAAECCAAIDVANEAQQKFLRHHELARDDWAAALKLERSPTVHPGGLNALPHIREKELARRDRFDAFVKANSK